MGEKKQIRISVKDKIACLVDKEQFLVCGNNDYEVVFDFDSDWEGINAKTAVFVYGNTPIHQPFVGNICEGVEIKNATICAIGVFAGDIKTTTGATIVCKPSIRDIGGVPKPPSKEVYDEIMDLLNKAISGGGGGNVDLSEYVKNTDYATSSKGGVVKATKSYGVGITPSGTLYTEKATSEQIDSRQGGYNPIVPSNLEYAVNSVVGEPINALTEKQTDLEERVADLESLTLTYTKDSATAYEKVAPAECGKYAMIKSIGGATEVIKSRNIFKPETLELFNGAGLTYNTDGSVTYTGGNYYIELGLYSLGDVGRYHYYIEGLYKNVENSYGDIIDDFCWVETYDFDENGKEIPSSQYFRIQLADSKDFGFNRTFKLMMWKDESVTTDVYEIIEAPEGTVFEPYSEPHFRHANVERVDTLCANLLNTNADIGYPDNTANAPATPRKFLPNTVIAGISAGNYYAKNYAEIIEKTDSFIKFKTNNGGYGVGYYFELKPTTKYTLSHVSSNATQAIMHYDNDGNYINTTYSKTITSNEFGKVVIMFYGKTAGQESTISEIMLVEGETQIPYKPFNYEPLDSLIIPESVRIPDITRNLDGYGLGIDSTTYNYLQIVDGRVEYVQTCKEVELTNTQTWTYYGAISTGLYRYSSQLPSDAHIGTVNGLCDRYPTWNGVWNANTEESVRFGQGNAALYLYLAKELTVSEVQTLMNGVKLIYKLAEPIVTDVTADIIDANPDFATKKGKLLIEGGGRTRFVNKNEMPVPNTVWYVTRKE